MNKILFTSFFVNLFFINAFTAINRLKTFEVCTNRFAPHLFVEFTETLYFEKKDNLEQMELELSFPAMALKDFKDKNVLGELKKLGSLIKDVSLYSSKTPSPRVVLKIIFSNNDILIRWNKLENPSRLVIDFFKKSDLRNLHKTGSRLLTAKSEPADKNKLKKMINLNPTLYDKNIRILVDAGHGGQDPGAQGFFLLKEKDVALDIARRTKNLLKKNGFNAFLTRNGDQTLSLQERTELAGQLKADFFISIHLNAVPAVEKAAGLESYYLNSNDFLSAVKRGGFLFVSTDNDKKLAKFADLTLKNNVGLSEQLASNIQSGILNFMKYKKLPVVDRGVKKSTFRVLLRSEIPVALVEVGFLTNKNEAKFLSTSNYRQFLAMGIYNGIKKYINSMRSIAL
jgi:N-acetylmuramoyl-L-alanine amidase